MTSPSPTPSLLRPFWSKVAFNLNNLDFTQSGIPTPVSLTDILIILGPSCIIFINI